MSLDITTDFFEKALKSLAPGEHNKSQVLFLTKTAYPNTTGQMERLSRKLRSLGRLWEPSQQEHFLTRPFYPFLDMIRDNWKAPWDQLFLQSKVSPLHRDLFQSYFEQGPHLRKESVPLYLPAMDWEEKSLPLEIIAMLEMVFRELPPQILVFSQKELYSQSSMDLLFALENQPIEASLWVLAYDPPGDRKKAVEDEEQVFLYLDPWLARLLDDKNLNQELFERRVQQLFKTARDLIDFGCFLDAHHLLNRIKKVLSRADLIFSAQLSLDYDGLQGFCFYGLKEFGQALECLRTVEFQNSSDVHTDLFFQHYLNQSEYYLFRNSFDMAAKALSQARKYQDPEREDQEIQAQFLFFCNPQLFAYEGPLFETEQLEGFLQLMLEHGYFLRFFHLSLRPMVVERLAKAMGEDRMMGHLIQVLNMSRKFSHHYYESGAAATLGEIYGQKYQLEKALGYYRRALKTRNSFFSGLHVPQIYNGMGYTSLFNGDLVRAHNSFQKALNLLFHQKNYLEVVLTLINLSYTFLYAHDFNLALSSLQNAYFMSRQIHTQDLPYHSRREIYLFLSYLYFVKRNYGKASEFYYRGLGESFDSRPLVLSLQAVLQCLPIGPPISDLRKESYLQKFWEYAEKDVLKSHYASLSLQIIALQKEYRLPLDPLKWWEKSYHLIQDYSVLILAKSRFADFELWKKDGFQIRPTVHLTANQKLKETLMFREAAQARMLMKLEKRIQEISLLNQIHQRILNNFHIEAFLTQVKDLIYRNFVCDHIFIYLDPLVFPIQSFEILTALEDLDPWIQKLFQSKKNNRDFFLISPHSLLPRKVYSFGYYPIVHENKSYGRMMIIDSEAAEEHLTQEDHHFLTVLADQISAGVALFHQNRELENRTTELMMAKEQVETSLKNLEKSQFHLIQSEKASAIGQLVAGVAHEINSPLGAVKSMANTLRAQIKELMSEAPGVSAQVQKRWRSLARDFLTESSGSRLSTKEERALRKSWEEVLAGKDEDLAEKLVELGWTPGSKVYARWSGSPGALSFGYQLSHIKKMVTVIRDAVRRAQKIAFALKSFTQGSQQQEPRAVSLPEGINTVLTLYRNRMKAGVSLNLEWEGNPQVLGVPEEINQVWTNLIQNALQAMDYKGELRISILESEEGITVEIQDSGPGVSTLLRERIFEPFFTTKKEGEGTGLGLHICKQIVERHQGSLLLTEGKGGGALFKVSFPSYKGAGQ